MEGTLEHSRLLSLQLYNALQTQKTCLKLESGQLIHAVELSLNCDSGERSPFSCPHNVNRESIGPKILVRTAKVYLVVRPCPPSADRDCLSSTHYNSNIIVHNDGPFRSSF